jgi:hypothetical protein
MMLTTKSATATLAKQAIASRAALTAAARSKHTLPELPYAYDVSLSSSISHAVMVILNRTSTTVI